MWRSGVTMVAASLLSISCTRDVARIETRTLPQQNPTAYEFDYPLNSLHESALNVFSIERQVQDPVFGRSSSLPSPAIFHAEESKNAVFGKQVLSRPGNEADIYLDSLGEALWESPVYRGAHAGLQFSAAFLLHLVGDRAANQSFPNRLECSSRKRVEILPWPRGPWLVWSLRAGFANDDRGVRGSEVLGAGARGSRHAQCGVANGLSGSATAT